MHYLFMLSTHRKSQLFLLFMLFQVAAFAQVTTPPVTTTPSLPTTTLPAGKVDPNQISNKQAIDFYNQAKSSGMSDMDIERAALQRGYTLDQISAMRKRLQTSDQKEVKDPNRDELDETRQVDEQNDEDKVRDPTNSVSTNSSNGNRNFGSSFFSRSSNTFEPNLRIATPSNYVLGPEDELVVDIYGNSVDNFRMKISPEGTVKMLNLAPVYVNGLTIEQANDRIVSRLRQAYSGLNRPGSGTYSSITLGNVRSIRVLVVGEASRPGTYTVSSLATAFNALSLSGGPNRNGSYRNIEIIRANKIIKKIDLYRFLLDADLNDNIALQDQDIILIRPFETRIELKGEVKRPGIFEARPGDKIPDLIRYAGGFSPDAFTSLIIYRRNTGTNYIVGSVDSTQLLSFLPQNGDIFDIRKILDVVTNQVEIKGSVTVPGLYPLEERSNTVLKLIKIAQGLSPTSFINRAILERASGGTHPSVISLDLAKLIDGKIPDVSLLPGDVINIKSVDELNEIPSLDISGSVIIPGKYYFFENMTISDLIFQAGGYSEGAIPSRIEVSRRVKNDTLGLPASQNVRIFTLNISENLKLDSIDQKFILSPYDIVSVRSSPRYETQKSVTVQGEVYFPGRYTILTNFERITDLFPKTGGLKPEAYLSGARFYRNGELVALDLKAIIDKPTLPSNLLLLNGDTLIIPGKLETVKISGGVQNPSVMNFEPQSSVNDYISQAGGLTEQAWKNRVYVMYPNGRTHKTTRTLFFRSFPKVEPGSTIIIPLKEKKQQQAVSFGERIAIFSLLSTLAISLIRLF